MTTQTADLAARLELLTGCDARTEPDFGWSTDMPCARCGMVTETALVADDAEATGYVERTCIDCVRA